MQLVFTSLYAIWFFVAAAAYLPVAFALWLAGPLCDPQRAKLNRLSGWYMYRVLTISPFWHFTFEGLENLPERPSIMVANHQSFADIVVLNGLPLPFRWVSKQSVFMVPFLGQLMALNGHVPLKRGDIVSTRHMMTACANILRQGLSIMMFPEGTRSIDGQVQPFKEGPFRVAKQMNVPVVPIAVMGTRDILAKGSHLLGFRAHVTVRVLPPISVSHSDDSDALKDEVRRRIANEIATMKEQPWGIAAFSQLVK